MAAAASSSAAVASSSAHDWRYLSEGKQHLVLAYTGADGTSSAHSPLHGRVLKISKNILRAIDCSNAVVDGAKADTTSQLSQQLVQKLHISQRYLGRVMTALFAGPQNSHTASSSSSPSLPHPTSRWFDIGHIVWLRGSTLSSALQRDQSRRTQKRIAQFASFSPPSEDTLVPVLLYEDYTSAYHLHLRQAANAAASSSLTQSLLLTFSPATICIELKPKWGFLVCRSAVKDKGISSRHSVKYDTCRYCMHQQLKFKKGDVPSLSEFCPLDLYSCHPPRVRHALAHLLQAPQNNLRIFVRYGGGGGDVASSSSTSDSVVAAASAAVNGTAQMVDLLDEKQVAKLMQLIAPQLSASATQEPSSSQSSSFITFLTSFLCSPSTPFRAILHRLAALQQQLDSLDIETLWPMIQHLMEMKKDAITEETVWQGLLEKNEEKYQDPAWLNELVQTLSSPAMISQQSESSSSQIYDFNPSDASDGDNLSQSSDAYPQCAHSSRTLASASPHEDTAPHESATITSSSDSPSATFYSESFVLTAIRSFLLSVTLKDVSIMCTMQSANVRGISNSSSLQSPPSTPAAHIHYSVRLIDLERKAVTKLPEYYRLDQEIVENYLEMIERN